MNKMTPAQYAKSEIIAGRFPSMTIIAIAGSFYLGDNDWNMLSKGKTYASKDAAMLDLSKILDRVGKFV